MENVSKIIVGLFSVILLASPNKVGKDLEMTDTPITDTKPIPDTITKLKEQNIKLLEENSNRIEVREKVVHKEVLPPAEVIYLRIGGEITEHILKRDEKTKRFIIDIDSIVHIKCQTGL